MSAWVVRVTGVAVPRLYLLEMWRGALALPKPIKAKPGDSRVTLRCLEPTGDGFAALGVSGDPQGSI
jgi:hypothetical protein